MSGHLRLFTLRPREITIIWAGAIKTAQKKYNNPGPDSEDKKTHKQENTDEKI